MKGNTPPRFRRMNSKAERDERAKAMAAMYRTGATLEQVGREFGVTFPRVSQILKAYGYAVRRGSAQFDNRIERRIREVLADGPLDTGEVWGALHWPSLARTSARLAMLRRRGVVVRVGRRPLAMGRGSFRNVWALAGQQQNAA